MTIQADSSRAGHRQNGTGSDGTCAKPMLRLFQFAAGFLQSRVARHHSICAGIGGPIRDRWIGVRPQRATNCSRAPRAVEWLLIRRQVSSRSPSACIFCSTKFVSAPADCPVGREPWWLVTTARLEIEDWQSRRKNEFLFMAAVCYADRLGTST